MKRFQQMMACVLALGLLTAAMPAFAQETTTSVAEENSVTRSTDLSQCYVTFTPYSGGVTVKVTTTASSKVTRIYHDVTIYKNGVWQLSETYDAWSASKLTTPINIAASSGDRIEVYVDHRTNNDGYIEERHTESVYGV